MSLHRYINSGTATGACTGCGKKIRIGANVWMDYLGPRTPRPQPERRLCDTCAALEDVS